MKGFSIQIGPWSQSAMNAIAAKGVKFERLVLMWDQLQGSGCSSLSAANASAYVSDIDNQLAWARNAGIYTELDIHLNVGRVPACASGAGSEFDDYIAHGQWITQYLANRYGNPSSPEYTKDVVGFGLNEPPPPNGTTDANVRPVMEQDQSKMLTWIRGQNGSGGYAPQWIGFVAYGYANAAPVFNALPGQTNQCGGCTNASPTAYNAVGGNVILDFHDYITGCTSAWTTDYPSSPASACDGRAYDGQVFSRHSSGGYLVGSGDSAYPTYPPAGETEATSKAQLANYIYSYKAFTQQANIPLMVGEFGWDATVNTTGAAQYISDLEASWASASPAIEMEWDYDVTQSQDGWAADPGAGATGANSDGWSTFADDFLSS